MSNVQLSVVIPVYRSERTLPRLVERLFAVLGQLGMSYEIVLVEDGSPDRSWDVLADLQAQHPDRVVAVQLMRNYGQHNALMCGFRRSRGNFVVTMDDDLQNPPEEIPKLLVAIDKHRLDLVYGSYGAKEHRGWRNLGSLLVNLFYRKVFKSRVTVTSFRVIRRQLLEAIFPYDLNFTFVDGLLAWNTQRVGEVPVDHHPRAEGRSGYSLGKLILLSLNLFTNFSLLPLQAVSLFGLFVSGCGFVAGLYYLVQYCLSRIVVPGYASTIIAVLVLGGIQLMALGVMGEYIGRLHLNVNRKPQYVERQILGGEPASLSLSGLAGAHGRCDNGSPT
jgi:undecaprenyl-phosphate 4-deoxy-4-formamido-L-arabinose transferase